MTTAAVTLGGRGPWRFPVGRAFVHPVFDTLIIGGGLSILVTALLSWGGRGFDPGSVQAALLPSLPLLIFFSNSAHFAASTVRLYTKPGAYRELRFLTLALPLVTFVVLSLAIAFAPVAGRPLQALYLTWSPYHYAAQAYGLAAMYCYRSGFPLQDSDKGLLRLACLTPFLHAFLNSPTVGIDWFLPQGVLEAPTFVAGRSALVGILGVLTFALPIGWFGRAALRERRAPPLISLLTVVSNGLWWITLNYFHAFYLATVFHGLQYLAVVAIFHVKDQESREAIPRGWLSPLLGFYAACLVVAYLLFQTLPFAFVALGFGLAESLLLVTAVINIHHFVVDAYIWRLRRDPNYSIVTGAEPAAA